MCVLPLLLFFAAYLTFILENGSGRIKLTIVCRHIVPLFIYFIIF